MIRSMTGYGDAAAQDERLQFSLELRSLNNRYFKVSTRLPEDLASLEPVLEARLRERVSRGSFGLTLKVRTTADAVSDINEAALIEYLGHLETVRDKVGDQAVQIDLTQLLTLPGVLQPAVTEDATLTRAKAVVPKLLDEAIGRLIEMRNAEGEKLANDLLAQVDQIHQQMSVIGERAGVVIDEYHDKLAARVNELMAKAKLKVDERDLIREVAVYADRADISEERSRMAGHLVQFREIVEGQAADEPAGRTLDFIAQEMLREANTIGSKCNDADISRAVVEMKSRIDRIKEQVQNVE